jgi:hypothetical protein
MRRSFHRFGYAYPEHEVIPEILLRGLLQLIE